MSPIFRKNRGWLVLFSLPAVLLFLVVMIVPLFQSVYYSFFEWNGLSTVAFRGWDNYTRMFTAREFETSAVNSLMYAMVLVIYQVGMSLFLASILTQARIRGKQLFRNLYFVPVLLSISVVAQLWKWVYNPEYGLINRVAELLGSPWRQNWLNRPMSSLLAVAFVECWKGTGYIMLIIYAGFRNVPDVYMEAAAIDGASPWQRFWHISMPLAAPTVRMTAIMCLTNGFRAFDTTYLMTKGGPGFYTYNMTIMMYNAMITRHDYGYGSAIAVLIVAVCVGIMLLLNHLTRRFDEIYQ